MGQYFFTSQYLYGSNHKYINQVFAHSKDFESDPVLKKFASVFLEHYPMNEMNEEQIKNLVFHIKNAYEFFNKKFTGEISIRTYSPDFLNDDHRETIIEIHTKDMPFLVDSVLAEVKRLGLGVYRGIYPIFATERTESGELKDFECAYEKKSESEKRESFIHLHITYQKDEFFLQVVKERLFKILQNVYLSVKDWREMTVRLQQARDNSILDEEKYSEQKLFLEHFQSGYFVFLGSMIFDVKENNEIKPVPESELGIICLDTKTYLKNILPTIESSDFLPKKGALKLHFGKLNIISPVHRDSNIDYAILVINNKIYLFLGLFTSILYYQSSTLIPIIRGKLKYILNKASFDKNSFSGKEVVSIIEALPRDELFVLNTEQLYEITMEVHALLDRPATRLFGRVFAKSISMLLFIPQERISAEVKDKIYNKLSKEIGNISTFMHVNITDSEMSYYHIILEMENSLSPKSFNNLEKEIDDLTRTWSDKLCSHIIAKFGQFNGYKIIDQFKNAFPKSYRVAFEDQNFILEDIAQIIKLRNNQVNFVLQEIKNETNKQEPVFCNLNDNPSKNKNNNCDNSYYLKVYSHKAYELSDLISMIQHFGFKVDYETVYQISPFEKDRCFVHVFSLNHSDSITSYKERVEEALNKVFAGHAVDDINNKLIMLAGFNYREVMLLRAIANYLYQISIGYSKVFMAEVLVKNYEITSLLIKLFMANFCPEERGNETQIKHIKSEITKKLSLVKDSSVDKILRFFVATIDAMLRTNYFIKTPSGETKTFISFKIDCSKIIEMPEPRPFVEIFVYSPSFEAIHLRTGKVARGGIRWSDRSEDFRTEVLGLVKAQLPKNTVIVPVGSKGGFVLKNTETLTSDEKYQLGVESYKNFIRGMLDITDNIVQNQVVPPSNVVRKDGDDPYLVVAADKGTATFSDTANKVAAEYSFWLGDAFASGGSAGYDHKKMAITARGAWVAVRRHFAELGIDTQKDEFTVVGIGDMSGDVFGNGMLLSEQIKLVAAFNHMHIFIDPNPDKKATFAERNRLFNLPRSTWMDFDRKALSNGAMIYSRDNKLLELTPEICKLLKCHDKHVEPSQLIKMLLCLEVDLIWNGGIGTYVKGSTESNYEVGDKSNDSLRVDGNQLRCKVLGEGGNLGMTQKGRIEFALNGGRLNTDFIDNSAGVDCSDHEVNIKIALNEIVASGKMTLAERDNLLAEMTNNVADLVLRDNYLQTLALTIAKYSSAENLLNYDRFICMLEDEIKLSRKLEGLPTQEEINQRSNKGQGLTRPELAVVLSYGKIAVYNQLIDSKVVDDPYFQRDLIEYFPQKMKELFPEQIACHFLRREIVATSLTNNVMNRILPYYMHLTSEDTGIKLCDIIRAYIISRDVFSIESLWEEISKLDNKIETKTQVTLFNEVMKFIMRNTSWLLRNTLISAKPIAEYIDDFRPGAELLMQEIVNIISGAEKEEYKNKLKEYKDLSIPSQLASKIALLRSMSSIFNIVQINTSNNGDFKASASVYFAVSDRLNLEWLRIAIDQTPSNNSWQRLAIKSYKEELYDKHRRIVSRVIKTVGTDPGSMVKWASENVKILARYDNFLKEIQQQEYFDLSMINLIFRRMDALLIKDLS